MARLQQLVHTDKPTVQLVWEDWHQAIIEYMGEEPGSADVIHSVQSCQEIARDDDCEQIVVQLAGLDRYMICETCHSRAEIDVIDWLATTLKRGKGAADGDNKDDCDERLRTRMLAQLACCNVEGNWEDWLKTVQTGVERETQRRRNQLAWDEGPRMLVILKTGWWGNSHRDLEILMALGEHLTVGNRNLVYGVFPASCEKQFEELASCAVLPDIIQGDSMVQTTMKLVQQLYEEKIDHDWVQPGKRDLAWCVETAVNCLT